MRLAGFPPECRLWFHPTHPGPRLRPTSLLHSFVFLLVPRLWPLRGPGWLWDSLVSLLVLESLRPFNPAAATRPRPASAGLQFLLQDQHSLNLQRCSGLQQHLHVLCLEGSLWVCMLGTGESVQLEQAGGSSESLLLSTAYLHELPCDLEQGPSLCSRFSCIKGKWYFPR